MISEFPPETGYVVQVLRMKKHSFRPHRGGYAESAELRIWFDTAEELRAALDAAPKFHGFPSGPWSTKFYAEDDRMTPSESYMVLDANGHPVGFSSLAL